MTSNDEYQVLNVGYINLQTAVDNLRLCPDNIELQRDAWLAARSLQSEFFVACIFKDSVPDTWVYVVRLLAEVIFVLPEGSQYRIGTTELLHDLEVLVEQITLGPQSDKETVIDER